MSSRLTRDVLHAPHRPQLAKGYMQLHSFDAQKSQALEAHAAAFASVKVSSAFAAQLR
jgi:hypothetical protein